VLCNIWVHAISQAQAALELAEVEGDLARASAKKRRTESFTPDVKAFALRMLEQSGSAAEAAAATEEHFAKQHRVFTLPLVLLARWAGPGARRFDPDRFVVNSRGILR